MPWKWVVEGSSLLDLGQEFFTKCDGAPKFFLSLENSVSHTLQLRSGEVPLGCHIRLLEVLFNGSEDTNLIDIFHHAVDVDFRHCQLYWSYQIHLNLFEDFQAISF